MVAYHAVRMRPNPPQQSTASASRRWLWLVARLSITAGAFYYLSTLIDLREVPGAIARLSPWSLLILVGAFGVAVGLGVERWRLLLGALGARHLPSRVELLRLYLVATFYNTYLPGGLGGELVRGIASRKAFGAEGTTEGLMVVLVERVMGLAGLLLLVATTTMWAPLPGVPGALLFGSLGVVGAVAPVLGLLLARRIAPWLPGRLSAWARTMPVPRRAGPIVAALGVSVAIQASVALGGHVVVKSVAPDLPFHASLAILPLASATVFLPISIGGAGFFEGTFVALYALFGVAEYDALAACLGYRLCYFLVAGSGGLWMLGGAPIQFVPDPDNEDSTAQQTGSVAAD